MFLFLGGFLLLHSSCDEVSSKGQNICPKEKKRIQAHILSYTVRHLNMLIVGQSNLWINRQTDRQTELDGSTSSYRGLQMEMGKKLNLACINFVYTVCTSS